jgi:HlyD family secretion protein
MLGQCLTRDRPDIMDIAIDPAVIQKRRRWRIAYAGVAVAVVALASVALARIEPAAPTVERSTLWIDTVKRGPMVRQVRGLGTLVPEDTRWLPATTEGRVERILVRPGATVAADTVIVELSSPQVEQEAINAQLGLHSAEAALANLRVQLQNELLTQQAVLASAQADYTQARLEAEANESLAAQKLVGTLVLKQSQSRAEALKTRFEIEQKRLSTAQESISARTQVQQAAIDQARAVVELRNSRLAALRVRPGFSGVLQQIPVEVGQQVAPGQNLARVADPGRLKAELKIAETQAKDVEVGQRAEVDTRNGIIAGVVSRKDPAAVNGTVTVDVTLSAELPRGAVPDLSVDGTIELERLENVLTVGRPAFGQEQSTVGLFRIGENGAAQRQPVKLGRSSVNTIEIVSGLNAGDQVVLSDTSAWDGTERVRIR